MSESTINIRNLHHYNITEKTHVIYIIASCKKKNHVMLIITTLQDIYVTNNITENTFTENACNLHRYNITEIYVILIIHLDFL